MVTSVSNALQAYAATANVARTPGMASREAGGSFLDLVKEAAEGAVQNLQKSEQVSAAAAIGKADLIDVVTAISNAEVTLQTVVTVRDRVVNAYQEIMRMPV